MITNVTFFESVKDLMRLTGINSRNDLWDAGFNLDDMDFGIVSEKKFSSSWLEPSDDDEDSPYYMYWMLTRMDSHCVGYSHCEYNGKHYYTVHHA